MTSKYKIFKSQKTGKFGIFYKNRFFPNFHSTAGLLYISLHKVKILRRQITLFHLCRTANGCKNKVRIAILGKKRYICQNVQHTTNKKRVQPWLQYFYCIITLNYLKKRFIYRTSSEPIARSSRYYQGDIIQVRGVITFVTGRLAIQFIGCTLYAPGHALFFFYRNNVVFYRIRIGETDS